MFSDEVPWPARMSDRCLLHELTDESAELRIPTGSAEPARLLIFPRPRRPSDGYGARHGLE
jgi:hypothetical protein